MKTNKWIMRILLGGLCMLFFVYMLASKAEKAVSFMYADF